MHINPTCCTYHLFFPQRRSQQVYRRRYEKPPLSARFHMQQTNERTDKETNWRKSPLCEWSICKRHLIKIQWTF